MKKNLVKKVYSYSVFYESAEEGGFVARVPALPGCHTQGETLEEAEKNAKEAIELYIESLSAHNEPIPEERRSFHSKIQIPVVVNSAHV